MTPERITHSLRLLARHKTFAATAVVCLGLAIALNTTMYSVLDAVINPRIDVPFPERLINVVYWGDYRNRIPQHEKQAAVLNAGFHVGVAGVMSARDDRIVERGSRIRDVSVASVSPNYFALIGPRPSAGRLLVEADLGAELRPIVVTERLWKQLFPEKDAFEPSKVFVGGGGRQIVGLLSQAAAFPYSGTDIWQLPLPNELPEMRYTLARMKPDVSLEQVEAEMQTASQRFREMSGEGRDAGFNVRLAYRKEIQKYNFHYALIGSVVAVLLIACANLANLQLARGVSRARELATRAAVGASRTDIVWQLVLETAWLALGGLVLGAVLTWWGIAIIDKSVPRSIAEYMTYPQVSWRVVAFAVGATLVCLTLVGLLPALRISRVDVHELLKSGAGTGKTLSTRRQYGALVVVEVGLALMLLSSTGLLVKSAIVVEMFDVPAEKKQIVLGTVGVRPSSAAERLTRRAWSDRVIRQAMSAESVTAVATSSVAWPQRRTLTIYDASGQPVEKKAQMWMYNVVSPEFFRVNRMPIVEGRDFTPGEFAEASVIIDDRAARALWPGKSPIGQQLKFGPPDSKLSWVKVIGVASEAREYFETDKDAAEDRERYSQQRQSDQMRGRVWLLNAADTAIVPMPTQRQRFVSAAFYTIVRGTGDPRRLAVLVKNAYAEAKPTMLGGYPRTWEESTGYAQLKDKHAFMASLFTVFALSALGLAALGVYAIIAHMVAQRTREFGVRIAVGAGEKDIRQMVIREGNILTLTGIALGLVITYKTAAWVRAFVFSDWDRYDSRVFAVVAIVLFGSAWLASYLPARRAMRINPVEALRND